MQTTFSTFSTFPESLKVRTYLAVGISPALFQALLEVLRVPVIHQKGP